MSDSVRTEATTHEPSSVKDAKWWLHKIADSAIPVIIASGIAGTAIYQLEDIRYKDITDGLRTQIGTQAATIQGQAATIKNEDATIAQLREQLKGTSPQLAAIQANRDAIRSQLQKFYIEGAGLFNRPVSSDADVQKLQADTTTWANAVTQWALQNMGEAATAKIHDEGTGISVIWTRRFNELHGNLMNYIVLRRRNLATLIETAAWDGVPKADDGKPFN